MFMNSEVVFKLIDIFYPTLPKVIALSIGKPTIEKIEGILDGYKEKNCHLMGCLLGDKLAGVAGFEIFSKKAKLKHLSILPEFRGKGYGRCMIKNLMNYFSVAEICAETDDESIGFYKALNFMCSAYEGKYGKRYRCSLSVYKNSSK